MTSCCCELSQLPSCRNAGANRDRTSLPRGVRTALSPKQGGKVGEKVQPCPLNRRACLTPPLCVCYTLDKLLKCTPALQHVCCRPLREGVGRNETHNNGANTVKVALYARAWVEMTFVTPAFCSRYSCRPLREGVGRNERARQEENDRLNVALYARAWVEMLYKMMIC